MDTTPATFPPPPLPPFHPIRPSMDKNPRVIDSAFWPTLSLTHCLLPLLHILFALQLVSLHFFFSCTSSCCCNNTTANFRGVARGGQPLISPQFNCALLVIKANVLHKTGVDQRSICVHFAIESKWLSTGYRQSTEGDHRKHSISQGIYHINNAYELRNIFI